MKKPSKGFVFGGRALDGKTIIYVNVCGHDDILPPQGPSGVKVDDAYIDKMGVDNLQIPIAVGNPIEVLPSPTASSSSSANPTPKIQVVSSSSAEQQDAQKNKKQSNAPKQFIIE